jgi:hypothetical protein
MVRDRDQKCGPKTGPALAPPWQLQEGRRRLQHEQVIAERLLAVAAVLVGLARNLAEQSPTAVWSQTGKLSRLD